VVLKHDPEVRPQLFVQVLTMRASTKGRSEDGCAREQPAVWLFGQTRVGGMFGIHRGVYMVPTSLYLGWTEVEMDPGLAQLLDLRLTRTVTLQEAERKWWCRGLPSYTHRHLPSVCQHPSCCRWCSLLRLIVSG
jgi:hypothetical protein